MGVSGISTSFPVLSRSSGQVAHVLLTRSPLSLHQGYPRMDLARLACVKHAASVRPEPGSNSPSRSRAPKEPSTKESWPSGLLTPRTALAQNTLCCPCSVHRQCGRLRDHPHWLLA